MIKLSTVFWLLVVSAAGFAMFAVKYQVQTVADRLAHTAKQIDDTDRDVRVLDAEWAYLNRPDALAQMNQRFLSLVPIATKQLRANVADLPMRPAPPPPPPPAPAPEAVAAAAPAPPLDAAPPAEAASPGPAAPPRPSEAATQVAAAVPETHEAAPRARTAPIRTAVRASAPRRAASLDELIARIAENRE